ncbi:MAG: hypothetical protein KDM91_04955, partial [Verrucomicrobiae bacterium]|nr:hypothetical protein [Verrucomicrobiae bacterium]
NCETRLSAEPHQRGEAAKCPECEWTFHVPSASESAPVVKFFCPYCERKLSATEDQWGKEIPCPFADCAKPVLVPRPEWKPMPTGILKRGVADPNLLVREGEARSRADRSEAAKNDSPQAG